MRAQQPRVHGCVCACTASHARLRASSARPLPQPRLLTRALPAALPPPCLATLRPCHPAPAPLQASPAGAVTLSSGANPSQERLDALNCVLSHLGMSVKASGPADAGAWSLSDGRRLQRFADGMSVPPRGPTTAGRAMVLLQAYAPGAAKGAVAAAQQASMQAAIAAGLLPGAGSQPGGAGEEDAEAARIRRLKAQGRYAPY